MLLKKIEDFVSDLNNIAKTLAVFCNEIDKGITGKYVIPKEMYYNYVECLDKNSFNLKEELSLLNVLNYFTFKYADMRKKFDKDSLEYEYINLIENNSTYLCQISYYIDNIEYWANKGLLKYYSMEENSDFEFLASYMARGMNVTVETPLTFKKIIVSTRYKFTMSKHALEERLTLREVPILYIYHLMKVVIATAVNNPKFNKLFKVDKTCVIYIHLLGIAIILKSVKRNQFGGFEMICTTFLKRHEGKKLYLKDIDNILIYNRGSFLETFALNDELKNKINNEIVWVK